MPPGLPHGPRHDTSFEGLPRRFYFATMRSRRFINREGQARLDDFRGFRRRCFCREVNQDSRKEARMKRLENKVAIVTGGALGIGRAVSLLFASEGARVAVTDLLDYQGKEVVNEIQRERGSAEFWPLDVSSEERVKRAFTEIHRRFGKIDILVNNAGISGVNKPTDQVTEEEWDRVMNVNVKGVFFC